VEPHSVQTATLARMIAEAEHTSRALAEQAFVAGLLHDVGKLIFAENLSKSYREVLEFSKVNDRPVWEAERQILRATHGDVGAYLLDLWGLPESVTKAVAMHHEPVAVHGEPITALAILHAANYLAHELQGTAASGRLNTAFIEETGLGERLRVWRDMIEQTTLATPV
jgi:putative nucleotidyltransferase with HDIG domain